MQEASNKNIHKFFSLLIAIVLMVPLFVKLNHFVEHQDHDICKTPYTNHFHEYNIDCDYYDFTLNTNFFELPYIIDFPILAKSGFVFISQYEYVSEYQKLPFSLRGPPISI